jgi:hypothetical protein
LSWKVAILERDLYLLEKHLVVVGRYEDIVEVEPLAGIEQDACDVLQIHALMLVEEVVAAVHLEGFKDECDVGIRVAVRRPKRIERD